MPTLIVQGTADVHVSVDAAHELRKANPRADVAVITGMNHVLKQSMATRHIRWQRATSATLGR